MMALQIMMKKVKQRKIYGKIDKIIDDMTDAETTERENMLVKAPERIDEHEELPEPEEEYNPISIPKNIKRYGSTIPICRYIWIWY